MTAKSYETPCAIPFQPNPLLFSKVLKITMESFPWLPTECADKAFPVQIVNGGLLSSSCDSVYIPKNTIVKNGWGEIGSIHIAGEITKPLPSKLQLNWFSFAEDKFFSGSFSLPLNKLQALFETGFFSPISKLLSTYKKILIGMALEGGVSLWVSGDGITMHVVDFVASESYGDWEQVLDNLSIPRKQYVESVMQRAIGVKMYAELRSKGLPKDHWKRIMSQYKWDLEIPGVDVLRIWIKALNGEVEFRDYENGKNHIEERETRAFPIKLRIDWRSADGHSYSTDIFFDAAKHSVLFKRMSSESLDEEMIVEVAINPLEQTADAVLRTSKNFIPLEVKSCRTFRN